MEGTISIKGTREGLTITLGSGGLEQLHEELAKHLKVQGAFFRGGLVALDMGSHAVEAQQIAMFRDLLEQHAMVLRTVVAHDPATLQAAEELGLRTIGAPEEAPAEPPPPESPPFAPEPPPEPAPDPARERQAISHAGERGLIVRKRLRAGQTLRHTGSVLLIGDVNVGAEIIAGGDVVVWGRLRGTVHAGYPDNASAVVCALDLAPLQLRLGGLIARPEEAPAAERKEAYPEVAYAREGAIVVERWTGIRWEE
jgi:septum site-determining protein MinC